MTWLRRIFWFGTIAYWIVLFTLTHMPAQQVHLPGTMSDKVAHGLAYFLLAFSLGVTLIVTLPGRRWIPLFVIATAMAYGAIDERTQLFVGRDCELGDWLADVSGATIAAVFLFILQFFVKPRALPVGRQLIAGFEGIVPHTAAGEAR